MTPEFFRAPFTASQGWGTFSQERNGRKQTESIELRWGRLRLGTLSFETAEDANPSQLTVQVEGRSVRASLERQGRRAVVTFEEPLTLEAGQRLEIVLA